MEVAGGGGVLPGEAQVWPAPPARVGRAFWVSPWHLGDLICILGFLMRGSLSLCQGVGAQGLDHLSASHSVGQASPWPGPGVMSVESDLCTRPLCCPHFSTHHVALGS